MALVRPVEPGPWLSWAGLLSVVLVLLPAPRPARATVEVTVTRVGFPTLNSGSVIRNGAWMPIVVDLDLIDQSSFDGWLRTAQFDDDGDACIDAVEVHLRVETGGTATRTLYVPASPGRNSGKCEVELLTDRGEAVEVLSQGELTYRASPGQVPQHVDDDAVVVLSLSAGTVGRVQDLVAPGDERPYIRPVSVAHLSPGDLPEQWMGLEAIDYIVWDDADPELLTERQVGALLEWVRQGGTLLIAASRSADALTLSGPLAEALPVTIGETMAVRNLREVRRELLEAPKDEDGRRVADSIWLAAEFPGPVPVAKCTLRDGSVVEAEEDSLGLPVVTRGRLSGGYVIYSAVTLKDLFSASGETSVFFDRLFYLNRFDNPDTERPRGISLFYAAVTPVSFATSGGVYLLVAALASVAYVLLATFGVWGFLSKRGWRHHSWNAFALAAIAASVLSVVVVQSRRGFGATLRQLSVIDAEAGDTVGWGTAYFGLKTSIDRKMDLWLPADREAASEPHETSCFLRPLPGTMDASGERTSFADPEEYRLIPASAVIEDVRMRATLKRFEGRWMGPLAGRLTGEIFVRGREMSEDSYVMNELGVDLVSCWLLHPVINADDQQGFRSNAVYAYELGNLPADGERVLLHPLCYTPKLKQTLPQFMASVTLAKRQTEWGTPFRSLVGDLSFGGDRPKGPPLGEEQRALMLLSTVGEYDPSQDANMSRHIFGLPTWSRDRARALDLRDQLQKDCVYLIGFTDDPGPIGLFRRTGNRGYRLLEPADGEARTMYRFRIPVVRRGSVTGSAVSAEPDTPVAEKEAVPVEED